MSGFLTKLIISNITPFSAEAERETLCGSDFKTCFEEIVFADSEASGDFWKEDKSEFLFLKTVSSDTVTFEIYRNCKKVANASNTYGDYYASFTNAPLYSGFIADWTKIYNAFGGGSYQIKIQYSNFGNSYTLESRLFRLYPYIARLAQNTVRIEGYQTGNIIGLDVDFSALLEDLPNGWYSSIRVPGRFGDKTPTLETDEYLNSSYKVTQNQNKILNEYTLETKVIPASVSNRISQNYILSNSVLITNYDLFDSEIYRRLEVVPVSFSEVAHFQEMGGLKYQITFRDRSQNIIKRNF
jgi:hypothetical protein